MEFAKDRMVVLQMFNGIKVQAEGLLKNAKIRR